jgi:MtN3 and saliva related transmembrane protein
MERHKRSNFERLMVVIGLINPFATIPQIIKVFATHTQHVVGQSLTTWGIYTVIAVLWVAYGVHKRELPLIIGNIFGVIMYGLVAVGIVIHAGLTF